MFKWKKAKHDLDIDVRFLLANERTLLAWVRTGLTLIAGGVAVAFVAVNQPNGKLAGLIAILAGGVLSMIGYVRYQVADAAIRAGILPPQGIGSIFVVLGVTLFAIVLVFFT